MRVSESNERSLGVLTIEVLKVGIPESDYNGIVEIWNNLLRHVMQESGIPFLNELSRVEFISLSILREWWYRYPTAAESFIYHRTNTKNLTRPYDSRSIPHFFDLELHGVFYHHALALLFIREFFPEKPYSIELSALRDQAVRAASTHTIATKFCLNSTSMYPRTPCSDHSQTARFNPLSTSNHEFSITATLEACPWLSPVEYTGRPYYLWDVAQKCTVRTANLQVEPYICISHTWGRWILLDSTGQPLEASVEGVPWPIPRNSKFDVQDIGQLLQNANFREQYVWFDLLCIPQCGYQQDIMDTEIARQAAIFGSSRLTGAWLNDIEDWVGTQHALRWLSALYFLQMSWGPGFRFGNKAPEFISPQQTRSPNRNIDLSILRENAESMTNLLSNEEERLPSWFTSLWTLQEFCVRPDMILYDRHWRPLKISDDDIIHLDEFVAFVSCAMTTMMRSWRFYIFHSDFVKRECFSTLKKEFECMDKKEKEIQDLINVVHDYDFEKIWPAGPAELSLLVGGSQLMNIYQGPAKILRFGDMRYCSGRRAEAIMSALGATGWYKEYMRHFTIASGQVVSEPNLVLGKYPAVFLNEVIKKIGSDFFAFRFAHVELDPQEIQRMFTATMPPIGSLLPFSAGKSGLGFQTSQHIELETTTKDHPTVKDWTVQSDGAVKICEAGIMAVSQRTVRMRLRKIFHRSGNIQYWTRMKLDAPLLFGKGECSQWLTSDEDLFASIPKSINLFMVCLGDGLVSSYGIILQEIATQEEQTKLMIKIGTWYSFNPSRPKRNGKDYGFRPTEAAIPSTQVDWKVL